MKVLQVTANYPSKENPILGIFMKEQVESLEQFGVENTIFFSNGAAAGKGRKFGGFYTHFKSVFRLQWHLLTHKYDIIHCHSSISGFTLLLSGGVFFNKCIVSFQNDPEKYIDKKYFNILFPFFNSIIVKLPTKYISRQKVFYLPNGCNIDFFRPIDKYECKKKIGLDVNKRYILFVDSNTSRKRIQKRRPLFDSVIHILHSKYGLNDIEPLIMIGVNRDMVPYYMNASELHLLTSDHEGSPNSVKECIACGVPVVSTDVGNVRDLLTDVPDCYISIDDSAENIAKLVVKSLEGKHMGIRDAFVKKGFDMESVANKLFDIYKMTIHNEKN